MGTIPSDRHGPIGVVHSLNVWLPLTMAWNYTQIRLLPEDIANYVVCDRIENAGQFPFERLASVDRDSLPWRWLSARSWRVHKYRRSHLLDAGAKACGAKILHSHFGDQGWSDLADARRNRLKHVVTFYGYDATRVPQVEPIWRTRYQEMFDRIDLCLCEGPYLGQTIADLGCPKSKIKVHHLGVDLERLPYQPRQWRPGQPLKVLIAGSFIEKKGIPLAIDALAQIQDRVDLQITIIGDQIAQERSQQEKRRIGQAIARSGLSGRTAMLGYQPYAALLRCAYEHHIFLSPSITASDGDSEGGAPVTIIEMAASGMPVVSSRHCDIPEVLEHTISGLLSEERDIEGIAANLIWLIENPDCWKPLTDAARRRIEAEFNARVQNKRLAKLYRSLC